MSASLPGKNRFLPAALGFSRPNSTPPSLLLGPGTSRCWPGRGSYPAARAKTRVAASSGPPPSSQPVVVTNQIGTGEAASPRARNAGCMASASTKRRPGGSRAGGKPQDRPLKCRAVYLSDRAQEHEREQTQIRIQERQGVPAAA